MTATVGSLCSGYGGLEMGLALALGSVRTAWHVEYDKHPAAILDHRYPGVPNHGDLTTTDWSQVEPIDLMTAGYPCQPFSHAGKRKGTADERHLWPYVADAIGALRPGHVLLENVAGHVSLGLDAVLGDLAALGYDARWCVVRAADAGAPHGRARLFVVAELSDTDHLVGRERLRAARDGWARPADGRVGPAADAGSQRHGHGQDARAVGRVDSPDAVEARERQRPRPVAVDRDSEAPADPSGIGRVGRTSLDGEGRTAALGGEAGSHAGNGGRPAAPTDWGTYGPAVARWEHVLGRPAPRPTEPGRSGQRLSPRFVEWLMGLPDGWVTDVPGLSRNAQLKALGNGVVPQQAALACHLLGVAASAERAA